MKNKIKQFTLMSRLLSLISQRRNKVSNNIVDYNPNWMWMYLFLDYTEINARNNLFFLLFLNFKKLHFYCFLNFIFEKKYFFYSRDNPSCNIMFLHTLTIFSYLFVFLIHAFANVPYNFLDPTGWVKFELCWNWLKMLCLRV